MCARPPARLAQAPPPGAQAAAAGQAPSIMLQVDAELGELAIFGSGREPSPWWPPQVGRQLAQRAQRAGERPGGPSPRACLQLWFGCIGSTGMTLPMPHMLPWVQDKDDAPASPQQAPAANAAAVCVRSGGGAAAMVNVDGEVALIVLRAAGGTCRFTYGAAGMTVHTALTTLEIEDLLVGPRCPMNRFLASSAPGGWPGWQPSVRLRMRQARQAALC